MPGYDYPGVTDGRSRPTPRGAGEAAPAETGQLLRLEERVAAHVEPEHPGGSCEFAARLSSWPIEKQPH